MKHQYIDTLLKYDSAWKGHGLFAMQLVESLKPEVTVDLGVDYGFSTFCLAYPQIGKVYGIDWFQGDEHTGYRNTYPLVTDLYKHVEKVFGVSNVELIKSDFAEAAKTWDKKIDILHIDGLHTYEAVKFDYETWIGFCKDDAVIMFHDVEAHHPTVGKFFAELEGYKIIRRGSAGLGILTRSRDKYTLIQQLIRN